MSARTTTTALHEVECDRCHRTEISTADAGLQALYPGGWLRFTVTWANRTMTAAPPWQCLGRLDALDLCPDCQGQVTLAECVSIYRREHPWTQ
jgi:hypothetical protein